MGINPALPRNLPEPLRHPIDDRQDIQVGAHVRGAPGGVVERAQDEEHAHAVSELKDVAGGQADEAGEGEGEEDFEPGFDGVEACVEVFQP